MTTGFPGGQLANIVDKIITTNIMYLLLGPIRTTLNNQLKVIFSSMIGTLISGTVFLTTALITVGLPVGFKILFLSVVLPACIINTIAALIIFNALKIVLKNN